MSELTVGAKAPDFTLESSEGGTVTLSALRGKPVVLYFYPKDDTPGCTVESKDFRDLSDDFARAGVAVFGVSRDSIASHCKFREKYKLVAPLLSDAKGTVTEAYGVWQQKTLYGRTSMGIVRTTVLLDADGVVTRVWPRVRVAGHAKAVLDAVTGAAEPGAGDTPKAAKKTVAKKSDGARVEKKSVEKKTAPTAPSATKKTAAKKTAVKK